MADEPISIIPAARVRSDGWTLAVQRDFIEHLALVGNVRQAARHVGRSTVSAYRLRSAPHGAAFRAAWNAALALAYDSLRDLAMDRIANGIEQPVFGRDGVEVGTRREYSDRLLMFMLDHLRPERHVDLASGEPSVRVLPTRAGPDPSVALACALAALCPDAIDGNGREDECDSARRASRARVNFV
jgi:hypothetical protein